MLGCKHVDTLINPNLKLSEQFEGTPIDKGQNTNI